MRLPFEILECDSCLTLVGADAHRHKLSEGWDQINDSSRVWCKKANHSTDPRTTLDCVFARIYDSRKLTYDTVITMISRNERGGGLLPLPKVDIPISKIIKQRPPPYAFGKGGQK